MLAEDGVSLISPYCVSYLFVAMAPKRKTLSFEEKGNILDKLNRGMRVITVANEYGVNESTIRTIRKNSVKIRAALQAGNAASSKSLRSASNIILARTEKILLKYLDRQRQAGIGVDNKLLRKTEVRMSSIVIYPTLRCIKGLGLHVSHSLHWKKITVKSFH